MRLFRWGLVGAALLLIAGLLMYAARGETRSRPDSSFYGPSGLAAFRSLLQQNGFKTKSASEAVPKLDPGDLLLVIAPDYADPDVTAEAVEQHLSGGGNVLQSRLPVDFASAERKYRGIVHPLNGKWSREKVSVSVGDSGTLRPDWVEARTYDDAAIWVAAAGPYGSVTHAGAGKGIYVPDAFAITNAFIAEADNARVWLGFVRTLTPKGGTVVFLDSAVNGGSRPSLMTTLGPWVKPLLVQMALIMILVAITLNRPLGLRIYELRKQLGQRELVDALAGTYRRGRANQVVLEAILKDADARLRHAYKISRDAPVDKLRERLPEGLQTQWHILESYGAAGAPTDVLLNKLRQFEASIQQETRGQRPLGRRRR